MKLIRFIPTPDGGSQFVEVDIPIDNSPTDAFGHVVRRSATTDRAKHDAHGNGPDEKNSLYFPS
jgi:hypothetical protein